ISRAPVVKAPAPQPPIVKAPTTPVLPASSQPQASAEALKRESARLQEQLSAMLFNTDAPSKPSAEPVSKVIEMSRAQAPASKTTSAKQGGLDAEETKIPSWLEPLPRNAATPAQNEASAETVEDDDAVEYEVQDLSAPATTHEVTVMPAPEHALDLTSAHEVPVIDQKPKKNKMVLIAAAAAGFLVLAAGTTWYLRQSPTGTTQAATNVEVSGAAVSQPATPGTATASASNSSNTNG